MSTNFIIEALQLSLVLYMNWYLLSLNLAAGVGIEPTQRALETRVLPLDEPAILYWRPHGDSNPGSHRERVVS